MLGGAGLTDFAVLVVHNDFAGDGSFSMSGHTTLYVNGGKDNGGNANCSAIFADVDLTLADTVSVTVLDGGTPPAGQQTTIFLANYDGVSGGSLTDNTLAANWTFRNAGWVGWSYVGNVEKLKS